MRREEDQSTLRYWSHLFHHHMSGRDVAVVVRSEGVICEEGEGGS